MARPTTIPFADIQFGDRVTFLVHAGGIGKRAEKKRASGTAVLRNQDQNTWVVNMGGAHGRPGVVTEDNFVSATRARSENPVNTEVSSLDEEIRDLEALERKNHSSSASETYRSILRKLYAQREKLAKGGARSENPRKTPVREADIYVTRDGRGGMWSFTPLSAKGKAWVKKNVDDVDAKAGKTFWLDDSHYANDIIGAALDKNLLLTIPGGHLEKKTEGRAGNPRATNSASERPNPFRVGDRVFYEGKAVKTGKPSPDGVVEHVEGYDATAVRATRTSGAWKKGKLYTVSATELTQVFEPAERELPKTKGSKKKAGEEVHEPFKAIARELTGKDCYVTACFTGDEA